MQAEREFEVVLFGATGFTGRLVAEYLALAGGALRWALAGRDLAKLERVRAGLPSAARGVPLLVADASAPAELAARAHVVATTVGPFARYGLPLVEACASAGTHYCDLTGEVHFIRRSIDVAHERARATGARIVHACGFDSVPSELGVLLLSQESRRLGLGGLREVKMVVTQLRGGASGGTLASILGVAEAAAGSAEIRRLLLDPYALSPERGAEPHTERGDQLGVRYEPALRCWTGPFVMAAVNTRVVRRSNALLSYAYGRELSYAESMSLGAGPRGLTRALGLSLGLGVGLLAAGLGPTRRLLARRLPHPGEGPSRERQAKGGFELEFFATTERGPTLRARVGGDGDPGYSATAKMLGESALALARDPLEAGGGVLTPAVALGTHLLERLRAAGLRFELR